MPSSFTVTTAIALLTSIALGTSCDRDSSLPVVTTWKQLELQPGIKVRGSTLHLGVESRSCPLGSGVLLYCLVESPDPELLDSSNDRLASLTVRRDASLQTIERLSRRVQRLLPLADKVLLVKSLVPENLGENSFTITHPDGSDVATVRIQATSDPFSPWSRFTQPRGLQTLRDLEEEGEGAAALVPLSFQRSGPAHPQWRSDEPITFDKLAARQGDPGTKPSGRQANPKDVALPTFFPRRASPAITISMSGTSPVLHAPEINFTLPHIDDHLLVRLWVNEIPFSPGPALAHQAKRNGLLWEADTVKLEIEWDLKSIGARHGDTIGLQLIYAPQGVEIAAGSALEKQLSIESDDTPIMPVLTERVSFVAR